MIDRLHPVRFLLLACLAAAPLGCVGSDEARDEEAAHEEVSQDERYPGRGLELVPTADQVRTLQLYRTGNETSPPFLALPFDRSGPNGRPYEGESGATLTLEFDLLDPVGRPLQVSFTHLDRHWQPDPLQPVQYLATFERDEVIEYRSSRATQVAYTHYRYAFPNRDIQFLVSGNYVLHVTERDAEAEVLFELPFVISERAADMSFGVQPIMAPGTDGALRQPLVRFTPPGSLSNNLYDYRACFVRNGRFERARCSDRPSLIESTFLQFYLEPEYAFEAEDAIRLLDLTRLEVGGSVRSIDYDASPFLVELEPDYALLGSNLSGDPLYGQTVVSERIPDRADPDLSAEYVRTRFRFVPPDDQPVVGPVVLRGSFNNWRYDPALELDWDADAKVYLGELLLKQGLYEYQYFTPDRRGDANPRRNVFNPEYVYSALMYYEDYALGTDRLLVVRSVVER